MKKILIAIAALLAVFSLRSIAEELAAPSLLEPVGVKRDTVQVTRGTIKQMLYFEGDVVAETTELWFSVDGEIESVSVLLGQAVKKGDVLITLSEKTLRERVLALEKQIEHQERMDEYDFELAQLDIDEMRVGLMRLRDEKADAKSIRLMQQDIEKAEMGLRQLRESRDAALDKLRDELDALTVKLNYNEIVAPCDGYVSYIRSIGQGDWVGAYDTVVCVTDPSVIWIDSAVVSETYASSANRVYAMIGAKEYDVTMMPVNWQENITISLSGGELRSEFEIVNPDEDVEAGMYACVCLETRYKEDVLLIPRNALITDSTGRYVYVEREGERVRQNVKVGFSTDTSVEVTEGLEEGEFVYVEN